MKKSLFQIKNTNFKPILGKPYLFPRGNHPIADTEVYEGDTAVQFVHVGRHQLLQVWQKLVEVSYLQR